MAENPPIRVAVATFGCKLNQAESETIARRFSSAGYRVVPPESEADVYLLNTCTVTATADHKARKWLRAARKRSPEALLVACGCYAERAAAELTRATGAIANRDEDSLIQLVGEKLEPKPFNETVATASSDGRNRSLIKIQDGCQNFCAYCIVPYVRRSETSILPETIINEIKKRIEEGCREVVLTGTKIGAYTSNGTKLAELTRRILKETTVNRLRLSSIQPQEVTEDLLNLWQNPKLCRHFHLALQSGCDTVLERMRRRYITSDYKDALTLIRGKIPGVAITTDIIAGFPGETDAEFEASYRFAEQAGFTRIHVFPYSRREGTAAAVMPGQIAASVKNARRRKMLTLARVSRESFNRRFLGQMMEVLWEQPEDDLWSGLTDNYIKVYAASRADLRNQLKPARLVGIYQDGVLGEVTP